MVDEIRSTWRTFESFRESVSSLIKAGPDRLRDWFPNALSDTPAVELTPEESSGLAALMWLSQGRQSDATGIENVTGLRDVLLEEAPDLVDGFDEVRPELERLLFQSPEVRQAKRLSRLAEIGLPNFANLSTMIDLRVDRALLGSGDVGLAPMAVMRLSFDEPIAGQAAVVFQMTQSDVRSVIDELRECVDDMDAIVRDLRDNLKPLLSDEITEP